MNTADLALPATFTPVFDDMLPELGLIAANVYGRVWRYCQAPEGVCYASNRTIAASLGIGVASVNRALKRLVAAGYLEDLTPSARLVSHRYRVAGRQPQPASGAQRATVPQRNTVFQAGTLAPKSVPHSRIKRQEIQETVKRQPVRAAESPELRLFREAAGFLPPRLLYDDVIDAVRKTGARLGREPLADDLRPYLKAWAGRGWKPNNLAWLYEWAARGEIPTRGWTHGNDTAVSTGAATGPAPADQLSAAERARLVELYNAPHRASRLSGLPRDGLAPRRT